MTKDVKVKAPKRRKAASLDKRKARGGWLFVMPFVIGFVLIYLPIVIESVKYSFYNIKNVAGVGHQLIPVGWANYEEALLKNSEFTQILVKGLTSLILDIPMILIFSLFMAVLLNQKMAGRAVFRAIFFIPVILSTGIMESIEAQNLLSEYMGDASGIDDGSGGSAANDIVSSMDLERLFAGMAIGDGLLKYVTDTINNIYNIVNRSGVQMLIFLAGLQSISPAIYESVQIDGATAWETFWKITFPMISPMILVNAVYTVRDSFTTNSNTVMTFIQNVKDTQIGNGDVVASAMSWIYFLIVIVIVALVALFASAFVFYQRRD